jgi:hypothetical protein
MVWIGVRDTILDLRSVYTFYSTVSFGHLDCTQRTLFLRAQSTRSSLCLLAYT